MKKPVRAIVAGAGKRGAMYASYGLEHPDRLKITGIADPNPEIRANLAKKHQLSDHLYQDWRELAEQERLADAVIIATQDQMHLEPAIAFAKKGYHILLEKPMAPSALECKAIVKAVKEAGVMMAIGHVLRYTRYTQKLKQLLDDGAVGEIVSVQHLEPLGYWHQAHSFVRGNWRNSKLSSFMLLAKSCHDLDWLRYIIGERCLSLSSFGNLKHFRKEAKPKEAGDALRCLDCNYEAQCPYSAKHIYLDRVLKDDVGMPVNVLSPDTSYASIEEALRKGPYGRCVYECDNDVVDHQIVNMLFEGGKTASFTMTGFNKERPRETHIFGTQGEIFGDGEKIEVFSFLKDESRLIDTRMPANTPLKGHSGGDYGLIKTFVEAVATGDAKKLLSGPDESLESHLMVFAAERARLEHCVIDL
ncbi:MAG: Gfo/Idh/MocA family oxidoreductase [Deinococcales bacterium]